MSHGIKKIRDAPQTIQAFNALLDANIKDKSIERSLWYQDETQDWITIADDDDLQIAYETAIDNFDGHLKVVVKSVEKKKEKESVDTKKTAEVSTKKKEE